MLTQAELDELRRLYDLTTQGKWDCDGDPEEFGEYVTVDVPWGPNTTEQRTVADFHPRTGDSLSTVEATRNAMFTAVVHNMLPKLLETIDQLTADKGHDRPAELDRRQTDAERYELEAELFYRCTGMIAPGKDVPATHNCDDESLRQKSWEAWRIANSQLLHALNRILLAGNWGPRE